MTTPEPPSQIARLPKDKHGRPVPAFVQWIDGVPDFRVMRGDFLADAHRFSLCWVCGQRRGRIVTFAIGPMCAVNRTSAEPPSHYDCALYSALACPFLSNPRMKRRERGLPEDKFVAGNMIERNPGVTLLWTTRTYKPFRVPAAQGGGALFELGDPEKVEWYAESRTATRDEVMESIKTGLPALTAMADAEGNGAPAELDRMVARALPLVPAA
jgi:hypothetical protein